MDHDASGHRPPAGGEAQPGYETRDANPRSITVFAVWLVIFLVVVQIALYGMYELFVHRGQPTMSERPSEDLYGQLRSLRQSEDETLSSYGWVDRKTGVVRVPIDRAMDLVAERGVPKGKGPRPEAEVNSHHGIPAKAEETKADETKAAPKEKPQ